MSFWTAIVVIVALGALVRLRAEKYRALGRRGGDPTALPAAELAREIAELRQRVAVLERIATDGRHSRAIAEEIEALRDR